MIDALAVQDGALLPGVGLQEPLEKEIIAVAILHLRLIKEMAMEMTRVRAAVLQILSKTKVLKVLLNRRRHIRTG